MSAPTITVSHTLRKTFQLGLARDKIIFLSAGPGWGKTAVAAKLLEQQNAAYLSLRRQPLPRYFSREQLIVLDDFHALPPQNEPRFRDILRKSLPAQRFILLSRGPVPEYLSFYEAAGTLLQLGEADLALDTDSLLRLAQAHGLALSARSLRRLLEETGGCPAAANLLLASLSDGQPLLQPLIDAMLARMGTYMEEAALRPLTPEARRLLLELSLFDQFDQTLADMLTEGEEPSVNLELLWRTSGLIQPAGALWGIHDRRFLLPHLRQKLRMGSPRRLQAVRLTGGRWRAGQRDLSGALYHYRQAGSREDVLSLLIRAAQSHPGTDVCQGLKDCAGLLTEEDIAASPDLICAMSLLRSMNAEPEEAERWYEALNDYIQRMDRTDSGYARIRGLRLWLDLSLPHRGAAGLPKALLTADKLLRSKSLILPELEVTGGLPSLLRGGRDFSEWVPRARELCDNLRAPAERVLGRAGTGAGELILTECLLEQGEDISDRFLTLAALRTRLSTSGTPEMEFVLIALLVRALCAAGNLSTAQTLLTQFRAGAVQKNEPRILSNIDAMRCRLSLLEDGPFASDWAVEPPPCEESLCWRESYHSLTRARCLIKEREHLAALLLLGRLLDDFQRCGRPLDRLEALILIAICRFRMGCGDWREHLAHALELGAQYGYTAVFTREGSALLPLLERWDRKAPEPACWDRILSGTVVQAGYYGQYLQTSNVPLIPLTQKELMILRLICQDKTNEEICSLMSIRLPTAKTHVRHLFKKLNVSNRSEAQSAAKRLSLLSPYSGQAGAKKMN